MSDKSGQSDVDIVFFQLAADCVGYLGGQPQSQQKDDQCPQELEAVFHQKLGYKIIDILQLCQLQLQPGILHCLAPFLKCRKIWKQYS